MDKSFFFKVPHQNFTTNAEGGEEYIRLISHGHAFYAMKDDFIVNDRINIIDSGKALFLATHKLCDNTYWIDWMVSCDGDIIEPKDSTINPDSYSFLFSFSLTLTISIFFITLSLFKNDYALSHLFITTVAILAVCIFLSATLSFYRSYHTSSHPRYKHMREQFIKAKKGDLSFFTPLQENESGHFVENMKLAFQNKPDKFNLLAGKIQKSSFRTWSTGTNSDQEYYAQITFTVEDKELDYTWCDRETDRSRSPSLRVNRPPFLAIGDDVLVLYRHHGASSDKVTDGDVVCLANFSESVTYVNYDLGHINTRDKKYFFRFFYCWLPAMLALLMPTILNYENDETIFNFDLQAWLNHIAIFALCYYFVIASIHIVTVVNNNLQEFNDIIKKPQYFLESIEDIYGLDEHRKTNTTRMKQ